MEHLTDQETHGLSQLTATSPQPSAASVQPGRRASLNGGKTCPPSFHQKPASDSSDKDSLSSSKLILHLGCDSDEDEEEELRNVKEDKENMLLLPASQDLKLCTRFTLTPGAGRRESECSRELLDLTTPHQSTSKSVDCPERPSKIYRTSTSHAENSISCRLLFSTNVALLATIAKEGESNDHRHLGLAATSQHSMPPHSKDGLPPLSTSLSEQALMFKGDGEELPTPIHSPRSLPSSSSCSDCEACSSASSAIISSSSPLSPPVFFLLSPGKFTVASSTEEELEIPAKDEVKDPPPSDGEDMSQECKVEDQNPHDLAEDTKEDVKEPPVCALDEEKEAKEEVVVSALPVSVKMQSEPMEVSFVPSSTGSVHSNWTAISGISPLPSSDPTHLHHHRHRHHHCHHHHGHHHHHHHHGHHHHHHRHTAGKSRDKAANQNDILVTSTPIHQRRVAEVVNVSSVTSSQDMFVEPSRFVVSSELVSPEPCTETENDLITSIASSDTKHQDQCPASMVLPVLLQSGSSHSTALGDTQLKSLRSLSENANVVRTKDSEGEMHCNIKKKKKKKRTDKEEPQHSPVKTRKLQPTPLFVTKFAKSRPLTKKEARILSSTPVNFSESFLVQENPPSHCQSFTFGQSSRGGSVERKLSVSV